MEANREVLKAWPAAREYLLANPDPELIEEHGHRLLSRALNIGRVVAFVGSGVSMSYGRIAWSEMVDILSRSVIAKTPPDPSKETRILLNLLNKVKDEGTDPKRYPIIFQLCKRLDELSRKQRNRQSEIHSEQVNWTNFEREAQLLVFDDMGHARRLIEEALAVSLVEGSTQKLLPPEVEGLFRPGTLERNVSTDYDRYKFRRLFSRPAMLSVDQRVKILDKQTGGLRKILMDAVKVGKDERLFLLPTRRFAFSSLLALVHSPEDQSEALVDCYAEVISSNNSKGGKQLPSRPHRSDYVPQQRDALLLLHDRLRISRYLTTNYDLDIERMFEERGYRYSVLTPVTEANTRGSGSSRHDSERTGASVENITTQYDALGATFRELVFEPARAGELIEFATQERRSRVQVVHLHGRATEGDHLVASERDYQKLYLQETPSREAADEALKLTFASNPILFVGLGMGEDDILRPLRHFMSQESGLGERIAVALLPSSAKGINSQSVEQVDLLNRYGVYALYYGNADLNSAEGEENVAVVDGWLGLMIGVIRRISEWLKGAIEECEKAAKENCTLVTPTVGAAVRAPPEFKADKRVFKRSAAGGQLGSRWEICRPRRIDGVDLERYHQLDISFELDIVEASLNATENFFDLELDARQRVAVLKAYSIATWHVVNALTSACFCARLLRLRENWDEWRGMWFATPRSRIAGYVPQRIKRKAGAGTAMPSAQNWVGRHLIDLPPTPWIGRRSDRSSDPSRFFADPPSQSLKGLCEALKERGTAQQVNRGRRVYLLLARRGVGKGHVFGSLFSYTNLQELLCSSWGVSSDSEMPVKYTDVGLFNLSFSNEVSSAFDRIIAYLWKALNAILTSGKIEAASLKANYESLKRARILRLKFVLSELNHLGFTSRGTSPRFVLAINGLGMLFGRDGTPKNAQVSAFFGALMDAKYDCMPIDMFLLTSSANAPEYFRREDHVRDDREKVPFSVPVSLPRLRVCLAISGSTSARVRERALNEVIEKSINIGSPTLNTDSSDVEGITTAGLAIVHVLRTTRASVLATVYFTRAALLLALLGGYEVDRARQRLRNCRFSEREILDLQRTAWRLAKAVAGVDEIYKALPCLLAITIRVGFSQERDPQRIAWTRFISTAARCKSSAAIRSTAAAMGLTYGEIERDEATIDALFERLAKACGGGRYSMTLLLATLDEKLGSSSDGLVWFERGSSEPIPARTVTRGPDRAMAFLDRALGDLERAQGAQREQIVFDQALRQMERNHADRAPCPFGSAKHLLSMSELELIRQIMWHLAVLGQPVDVSVLLACPEIASSAATAISEGEQDFVTPCYCKNRDASEKEVVEWALDILVHRCFVFKISPLRENRVGTKSVTRARYSVHRMIQRSIFRQLQAPFVEFPDVNHFSISLYASQPNDLPRLTSEVHQRVGALIDGLSAYPGASSSSEGSFGTVSGDPVSWAGRLRAAFAVLRSVYSLAIVSRFDGGRTGLALTSSEGGLFEQHRLRVRWLITSATHFDAKHRGGGHDAVFYDEEIVWLLNEVGVLSLAQGNLNDATGMLAQARDAVMRLEEQGGGLTNRILLNACLADIERGAAIRNLSVLQGIVANVEEEIAVRLIAYGYVGLIEHLGGRLSSAVDRYEVAISCLGRMGHSRAASIFARHLGDLYRSSGTGLHEFADQRLAEAVSLAARGGHSDIAHLARLSQAQLKVEAGELESTPAIMHDLDDIEAYGKLLGMPRLLCMTQYVRARLLLGQGETAHAARLAAKGLEIATVADLRLRKVNALMLVGEALFRRGLREMCRPVYERAAELAATSDYHAAAAIVAARLGALGRQNGV